MGTDTDSERTGAEGAMDEGSVIPPSVICTAAAAASAVGGTPLASVSILTAVAASDEAAGAAAPSAGAAPEVASVGETSRTSEVESAAGSSSVSGLTAATEPLLDSGVKREGAKQEAGKEEKSVEGDDAESAGGGRETDEDAVVSTSIALAYASTFRVHALLSGGGGGGLRRWLGLICYHLSQQHANVL